jgi:hemerythrin superfamily protein
MATKKSSKSSKRGPDAIALLKEDHKKVKGLLGDLEKSSMRGGPRAQKLVAQIDKELTIHSQIEEEIFYPAFRDAVTTKDDKKMYYEAKEEHHVVKLVLPEVEQDDMALEEFAAKCKVLKELVEHHADEEEKEMFPEARKALSRAELQDLGDQLAARKKELGA